MQRAGIQAVGQELGGLRVGDGDKGVVGLLEGDAGGGQLTRQPGVAVEVDLQAKRCPGGYAQVAQAELRIDEVVRRRAGTSPVWA
jgi:hypothetical protein